MFDFVAIDFETATESLDSACALGIVAVKNLEPVETFYSLIRPPENRYDQRNIAIHHITPEMTADSPTLTDLWPEISRFFTEHVPVVAHNAHFDMSVLRLSTDVEIPNFTYVDSCTITSQFSEHKGLHDCASAMGVDVSKFEHHDAKDDAKLCAFITTLAVRALESATLWECLARCPFMQFRAFADLKPQKTLPKKRSPRPGQNPYGNAVSPKDIKPTCPIADGGPLCGKSIVFTGTLSIDRDVAMQLAVNAGASVRSSVSKKTDFLVVGQQDKALVGDDGMSSKEEKAHALNDSGQADIRFLSEAEFLELLKEAK